MVEVFTPRIESSFFKLLGLSMGDDLSRATGHLHRQTRIFMMGRAIISILFFLIGANVTSAQTVSIADPNLRQAIEAALDKTSGAPITEAEMDSLIELRAPNADISDLTGLETAVNLQRLDLGREYVSAEGRFINNNSISDLTPLAGLTQLTVLDLNGNAISDISVLSGLTNLVVLRLGGNVITDISALSGLTNLVVLRLWDNNISDISPLVANRGLGAGEGISVSENPLNDISITVHIPALQDRGVEVHFSNLKPPLEQFLLSMPTGLNLVHIPLNVSLINGLPRPIRAVSDLYAALGGAGAVNFLVTYDSQAQQWFGYFDTRDTGSEADRELSADTGIIAGLFTPVSIYLSGTVHGADGISSLGFTSGLNLVGLPLRDSRLNRVSDLLSLEGLLDNTHAIILTEGGEFKLVARADDPGDIGITGGQGFIVIVERSATVTLSGEGWYNTGR